MGTCILFCMILLTLISIGLVGGILLTNSSESMRELAIDSVVYLVQSSAESIDAQLEEITGRCSIFTSDYGVYEQLQNAYAESDAQTRISRLWSTQRALVPMMTKQFSNLDALYTVNLVTDDFVFNEAVSKPVGVSTSTYMQSELYQAALKSPDSFTWIPTYRFADMFCEGGRKSVKYIPEYLFSVAVPLRMYCMNLQQKGTMLRLTGLNANPVLVLSFYPTFFDRFFKNQNTLRYCDVVISDEDGLVVYSNNSDLQYCRMSQEWIDQVMLSGKDRGVYGKGSAKRFYCNARINENGWHITVSMPWEAPAREVRKSLLYRLLTLVGALGVLISVLTLALRRILMRPIYEMQETLSSLGEGDFDSPLPKHTYYEFDDMVQTFSSMRSHLHRLIHENYEIMLSEREAELAALNLQLNPHFLYNTLNIVDWMIDEQSYDQARQVIRMLSKMLRYTSDTSRSMVTLGEDLKWLESYVRIISIRYSRDYRFQVEVPEKLMEMSIPKLLLQPFIENTVLHGFKGRKCGTVSVHAVQNGQNAVFEVCDDGNGIPPETLARLTHKPETGEEGKAGGIGVQNVYRRLKLLYDERYSLEFDSVEGEYTRVRIAIPINKGENNGNI